MGVESYSNSIFKKYGLSEKEVFNPEEFQALEGKLSELYELEEKEGIFEKLINQKVGYESSLTSFATSKLTVQEQINNLGEIPETAPESLTERWGWLQLIGQKESFENQLNGIGLQEESCSSQLISISTELQELQVEISTKKTNIRIGGK